MKVISGKYKGRRLDGFDIDGTRPTMDRVQESLFAMIQNHIVNAVCLDLFSGSGNLGIEALSMGARESYFVDKNKKAFFTIKKNLEMIDCNSDTVFCMDYQKALKMFSDNSLLFDVIFLDPPYQTDFVSKSVSLIVSLGLLSKDGIIVCESDNIDKIEYPSCLEVVKMKKYGDKLVAILRYV